MKFTYVQEYGVCVRVCRVHGTGHQDVPELEDQRQQVLHRGENHEQGTVFKKIDSINSSSILFIHENLFFFSKINKDAENKLF